MPSVSSGMRGATTLVGLAVVEVGAAVVVVVVAFVVVVAGGAVVVVAFVVVAVVVGAGGAVVITAFVVVVVVTFVVVVAGAVVVVVGAEEVPIFVDGVGVQSCHKPYDGDPIGHSIFVLNNASLPVIKPHTSAFV